MTWDQSKVNIDPTAGTTLVHHVYCPRCGFDKGHGGRRGLCSDCSRAMPEIVRRRWAA